MVSLLSKVQSFVIEEILCIKLHIGLCSLLFMSGLIIDVYFMNEEESLCPLMIPERKNNTLCNTFHMNAVY